MSEAAVDVNMPPMHPFCRCKVTTPEESLEDIEREIDERIKNWNIPKGMSLDEFIDRVNNGELEQIRAEQEKSAKSVDNPENRGIMKVGSDEVVELRQLGTLDAQSLEKEFGKLKTDEVIVTEERITHIKDHHPQDYELFEKYGASTIHNPDEIIKDTDNENTVFMVKRLENTNLNVITKLILESETKHPDYKNSVMSFYRIRNRNLEKLENKHKVLYKKE